jgi:hypothetical protein
MKQNITRLASDIIDLAAEIGAIAEASDSIIAAETVILLRDCERMLNQAKEALQRTTANNEESPA